MLFDVTLFVSSGSEAYRYTCTVDSRYLEVKGPSETLRDIRTSTYQIFRIEEKINRTTKFLK